MKKWVTNIRLLADQSNGQVDITFEKFEGKSAGRKLIRSALSHQAMVLHPCRGLRKLALLRRVFFFLRWAQLVLVDVVFPEPTSGLKAKVAALLNRFVWSAADLFIVYHKDVTGVCDEYVLKPDKFAFVDFKVNSYEQILRHVPFEQGYVLTGGKSRRDFATFCSAMACLPSIKAIILTPTAKELGRHGTQLNEKNPPQNVEIVHDDGSADSWIQWIAGAKIVVLCISPKTLTASGISACLTAMGLGKPVVITDSPATRGIFESGKQLIVVPPEDPDSVARAVKALNEDSELYNRISECGRKFALGLGDRNAFGRRIMSVTDEALTRRRKRIPFSSHDVEAQ